MSAENCGVPEDCICGMCNQKDPEFSNSAVMPSSVTTDLGDAHICLSKLSLYDVIMSAAGQAIAREEVNLAVELATIAKKVK
jgi:hypothetical protein